MPRIPSEQLINTLFGPPKTEAGKKLADFAAKSIPKPEKPPSMEAGSFVVHDAVNPYREALQAGGAPDSMNPERLDRTVDLEQTLNQSLKIFEQGNLNNWHEVIKTADFNNLTPENRGLIEKLIKEGWEVTAVMPGKPTTELKQKEWLQDLKQSLTTLKPLWIKESQPRMIKDPYIWEYFTELIDNNNPALYDNLPERPYILLTEPTQKPNPDTCNKKVPEQQNWLTQQQVARPLLNVMSIGEYAAMQAMFTRKVNLEAHNKGIPLSALTSLDSQTYTRFINLPLSTGGNVPNADFFPGNSQLRWSRDDADDANSRNGFRLSVRVEI